MRPDRSLCVCLTWLLGGWGCGLDPLESDTGAAGSVDDTADGAAGSAGPSGTVLLIGSVPTAAACDTPGATAVRWQAKRVGCVEAAPAPCTLPAEPQPIEGDSFSCPRTDPTVLLAVGVEQAGRYQVEALLELTAEDPRRECYAVDGEIEILVTTVQLEAGGVVMSSPTGSPCP